MKILFSTLIGCMITFCSLAQVTIPDDVARFYLEQNDKIKVLEAQNRIKDQMIANCDKRLLLQTKVITTYVSDSAVYKKIISTKDEELALTRKELRRQKRRKTIAYIGIGLIIVVETAKDL